MPKFEITNMVMVQNPENGLVVAQERVKYWCGVVFPGGHPEENESIYDSAIREIKEETGLEIRNLKSCGFMYWDNNKTGDKYFCYFYKTTDYSGELLEKTDEGRVFWTSLEELIKMPHPTNFMEYLPMFLEDKYSEAYCSWNEDMNPNLTKPNPWGIIYR